MNVKWFFAAVVMLAVLAVMAVTADASQFSVTPFASGDMAGARAMYRTNEAARTAIGIDVAWLEDVDNPVGDEAIRYGFVGTYDVIQDAPMKIFSLAEIDTTVYIGVLGGFMTSLEDRDSFHDSTDPAAALITGVRFGDGNVRLGIEYQYLLDSDLWKEFGDFDENSRLVASASILF